jgi:lipoprotein-anchoring transpeptidase ErfK/SrfK
LHRRALPLSAGAAAAVAMLAAGRATADAPLPPWYPEGDVPPPAWARSVRPRPDERGNPGDLVLFAEAARTSARRGVTTPGTSLPFFGSRRGPGCTGTWWLVGPLAWACSDEGELAADEAAPGITVSAGADGLSASYFFVGRGGASAYASLQAAEEGTADRELEGGWGIAAVEQRPAQGETWVRSTKGLWLAMKDLVPARPATFHGEVVQGGRVDFAWVLADRANVWAVPSTKDKPQGARPRFDLVRIRDDQGAMVHLEDGSWMLARDLARPTTAPPPAQVVLRGERWIDVELASQTLVAYEGTAPVYATLVSTGRAGPDATPRGEHRIWVKIAASDMGNAERSDVEAHYSLEDVPYVQFFDHSVALHGTYWHRDFGHARSHGCVNLAPLDARWLFGFTGPRVPAGWASAYPTPLDEGAVVRVR